MSHISSQSILLYFTTAVKERYNKQLHQQKQDAEAIAELTDKKHQKKIDRYKSALREVQRKLVSVELQWSDRLHKLESELSTANDLVVSQKSKYRSLMQRQIDEASAVATQVQNYEESFLQENNDLRSQLKKALSDKRAAVRQSKKDKQLAQSRLAEQPRDEEAHEERMGR